MDPSPADIEKLKQQARRIRRLVIEMLAALRNAFGGHTVRRK